MALSPLQVLGISSLTLVGSGVLSSKLFIERNSKVNINKNIITNSEGECDVQMINIYIVKRPDSEGKIQKMKKNKEKNNKEFFRDRHPNPQLEEEVIKGCKNGFRNAYLYEGDYNRWVYDKKLQEKNLLEDQEIQKLGDREWNTQ